VRSNIAFSSATTSGDCAMNSGVNHRAIAASEMADMPRAFTVAMRVSHISRVPICAAVLASTSEANAPWRVDAEPHAGESAQRQPAEVRAFDVQIVQQCERRHPRDR
jgi:hypothetical protein